MKKSTARVVDSAWMWIVASGDLRKNAPEDGKKLRGLRLTASAKSCRPRCARAGAHRLRWIPRTEVRSRWSKWGASDKLNAMSMVQCGEHGPQQETFTCEHLVSGSGLGFNYNEEADNPRPDAWCDACEEIRRQSDGWNEESESKIKIVLLCGKCYDATRERNSR